MSFPTIDELDAAYAAGESAPPGARNPYFYGSPLHMQWNYGRRDGAIFKPAKPTLTLKFVAQIFIFAVMMIIVVNLACYALL